MSKDNTKGIMLALITALISGISVFINGLAVQGADPIGYTALKNIGVLVFLGALVYGFKELRYFRGLNARQWSTLIVIGIIGGSMPFMMFFWGLKLGGAAVSSFIYRSLFVFAGVFGYFILKEKIETRDIIAGLVILIGNAMLISGDLVFGFGQYLVLGATILWALEYAISRKIMSHVHPRAVMASRMLFGSVVLLAFMAGNGSIASIIPSIEVAQWLIVTSLLLFGFVLTWYSALKYIPVLKASALLSLGGIITAVLNFAILGKSIPAIQLFGLILAGIGALSMFSFVEFESAVKRAGELKASLVE